MRHRRLVASNVYFYHSDFVCSLLVCFLIDLSCMLYVVIDLLFTSESARLRNHHPAHRLDGQASASGEPFGYAYSVKDFRQPLSMQDPARDYISECKVTDFI